jgi:Holliday junction resolvase RusA-like endonuclease
MAAQLPLLEPLTMADLSLEKPGPTWRFEVLGKPQPGGSKTAFVIPNTKRAVVVDANKNLKPWKAAVQEAAREQTPRWWEGPLEGPVYLSLIFVRQRPKHHFGTGRNEQVLKDSAPRYPTGRPDTTKLTRGLEDALTGVAWKDDAQIVTQVCLKRYADPGEGERVVVEITPL